LLQAAGAPRLAWHAPQATEASRANASSQPDAWFAAGWLQAHLAVTAQSARKSLVTVIKSSKFWA